MTTGVEYLNTNHAILVNTTGTVVLGNNERIKIPDALLIVWEVRLFLFISSPLEKVVGE